MNTKHKRHIVILAAGAGTRMRSKKLKVLHQVAGLAMVSHVYQLAQSLNPSQITMVFGHQGEQLKSHFEGVKVNWAEQKELLGTGHAVQQAVPYFKDDEDVLVLYGDAPLVTINDFEANGVHPFVLTAVLDNPAGYGRIIKSGDFISAIVEEKDANEAEKQVNEINSGIIQAPAKQLTEWLNRLSNDNNQGEYYLTDVIAMAATDNTPFEAVVLADSNAVKGANDMFQLADLEAIYQNRVRTQLMKNGVRLINPETIDIRGKFSHGTDVVIDKGVVLSGVNELGNDVMIGSHCVIKNCQLAAGTVIEPHSVLDGVVTNGACSVGPFARLRIGTTLSEGCKIGNFVETKKTSFGQGSKASHLSYLGDAEIGNAVNIGAGTITCNYDGVNKFKTEIGDGAFIGSNSSLVAPVKIGNGATVGAGRLSGPLSVFHLLRITRSRSFGELKPSVGSLILLPSVGFTK